MFIPKEILGFIGVALVLAAYLPYLRNIIRRKVLPHPFTWLVWMVSATLISLIQMTNGAGPGAYATATIAVMSFCIFTLAIRFNKTRINPLDVVSLGFAFVGLVIWVFVDQPLISLLLLLSVELIGFTPTLRKGYKKPYEDSLLLWATNAARHLISLSAITHYSAVTMLNPLVWAPLSLAYCGLLLWRRHKTRKPLRRVKTFQPHN